MEEAEFRSTLISVHVEAAFGGIAGYQTARGGEWLRFHPSNALTDVRIKLDGIDQRYLTVEYNAHISGIGDTGWLDAGKACNEQPDHQILAIRIRLRGQFASACEIEYGAVHTVAQRLLGYYNGHLCGVPGISRSDAGGGNAWLHGLYVQLNR